MGQHGVRSIAYQPHAAVHVARQFIELMQRPKSGCQNAFEQHLCSVTPVIEGGQHFFLAGIAHPWRIAWPGGIRATAVGNKGDDVDQPALFNGEGQNVRVKSQVHLRHVNQMLIDPRAR